MIQVSCGARHSALLTKDGEGFCCGCNKHGEAGQALSRETLTHFEALSNSNVVRKELSNRFFVRDIECGWWHTILLAEPRRA